MSEHAIELHWQRSEPNLQPGKFSNAHTVRYSDRCGLQVDASPDWGGDSENTNPEQALAASLSSCHMMTFLALASIVADELYGRNFPVVMIEEEDFARIESGGKSYSFETADVTDVLAATLRTFEMRLKHEGFEIEYEVDEDGNEIVAEADETAEGDMPDGEDEADHLLGVADDARAGRCGRSRGPQRGTGDACRTVGCAASRQVVIWV